MSVDKYLRKAPEFWERGRRYEDEGRLLQAGHCHTRGLGGFLSYVKLTRTRELAPACRAFGALALGFRRPVPTPEARIAGTAEAGSVHAELDRVAPGSGVPKRPERDAR